QVSARRLDRVFARIAGCEEWGVRIFAQAAPPAPAVPARKKASTDAGRRFLERKRTLHRAAQATAASAPRAAGAAYRTLSRGARAHRKLPVAAGSSVTRLLVDAAFLVPREERQTFRDAVASIARGAGKEGLRVSLTGPWPAYNFVDEER